MRRENDLMVNLDIDDLAADGHAQQTAIKKTVTLNDVRALAEKLRLLEDEVEALEAQTTIKRTEYKKVAEQELPELLNLAGLPSITLTDGTKIGLSDLISASITDENRAAAHQWFRDEGFGDLIKNTITATFGKGEDADAAKLISTIHTMAEQGNLHVGTVDQKEVIHPSTLKAFVKERLKDGKPLPAEKLKLYVGQVCRISKPKVKV